MNASDLVTMVGDLLERARGVCFLVPTIGMPIDFATTGTRFHVKLLPHARIPNVKLNLAAAVKAAVLFSN